MNSFQYKKGMNTNQKGGLAEEEMVTVTVLEEDGLSLSTQKVTTMATLMLILTRRLMIVIILLILKKLPL